MSSSIGIGLMGPPGIPGVPGRDSQYFDRKPVLVMRFPYTTSPEHLGRHREEMKGTELENDYHILIMKDHDPGILNIRFEVLNCSEMSDIRWNDLVDMVMDDLDPDRVIRRESDILIKRIENEHNMVELDSIGLDL